MEHYDWANDLVITVTIALAKAAFELVPKEARTKDSITSILLNLIGRIAFAMAVGYITTKLDMDWVHTYHDIVVAFSTIVARLFIEKVEVWFKKKKLEDLG